MEWWTYGLSDFLMFSPRVHARLVAAYNDAAWPAQVPALLAGAALLALAAKARLALALLALAWATTGWAFHWSRYADIFLGAPWLAGACGLQALLCLAAIALPPPASPVRLPGAAACWSWPRDWCCGRWRLRWRPRTGAVRKCSA